MTTDEVLDRFGDMVYRAIASDEDMQKVSMAFEKKGHLINIKIDVGLLLEKINPQEPESTALVKQEKKITWEDIKLFRGVIDLS